MKKVFCLFLAAILGFGGGGPLWAASVAGYVASKGGEKYHAASCSIAKQIKGDKLVTFPTPEEAVKAGYKPCKVCNPPEKTIQFVGSKDSAKYHTAACRLAQNIKPDNKVTFATKEDAEKAKYTPCAICFPAPKPKKS